MLFKDLFLFLQYKKKKLNHFGTTFVCKTIEYQNVTTIFKRTTVLTAIEISMRKLNQFMILQWLIFLPLILPLSIASGALQGIKHAFLGLVNQIRNDIESPLIHEDSQDSFA